MISKKATFWVHEIIRPFVETGRVLVDGTLGNGYDLLYLAKNSSLEAKIYGFDIQPIALEKSRELLTNEGFLEERTLLYLDNHFEVDRYITGPIDVGILNLGYLPSGDKTITTWTENTIATIEKWLDLLSLGGVVSIVCYPGHLEGEEEASAVTNFLGGLSQKYFQVMKIERANLSTAGPYAFFVERVGEVK